MTSTIKKWRPKIFRYIYVHYYNCTFYCTCYQCEVLVEEVEYLQGQVDEFNNKLIKMEEESEEKKENMTSLKHQVITTPTTTPT